MSLQDQFKSFLKQREALDARREEWFRKTFEKEWYPGELEELDVLFGRDVHDFFAKFSFENVEFIVRAAKWHKAEDDKPFFEAIWIPSLWKAQSVPLPFNQQDRIDSKDDIKRHELKGYVLEICVIATVQAKYSPRVFISNDG